MLSAFSQLAVATLLGPEKEREINWYLQPGHKEKLIRQLTPIIHKISEIVLRCAISVSKINPFHISQYTHAKCLVHKHYSHRAIT